MPPRKAPVLAVKFFPVTFLSTTATCAFIVHFSLWWRDGKELYGYRVLYVIRVIDYVALSRCFDILPHFDLTFSG